MGSPADLQFIRDRKRILMPANSDMITMKGLLKQPLKTALCLILVAIVVVTFIQVVFRYVFHHSLSWSEELARFLFVWISLLGAAYGFKVKSHFAVVFLVNRFGERLQRFIGTLVVFVVSAFLVLFIVESVHLIIGVSIRQIAPGTGLSMAVPHSAAPVGGVLMLYYLLRNWWSELRRSHGTSKHM